MNITYKTPHCSVPLCINTTASARNKAPVKEIVMIPWVSARYAHWGLRTNTAWSIDGQLPSIFIPSVQSCTMQQSKMNKLSTVNFLWWSLLLLLTLEICRNSWGSLTTTQQFRGTLEWHTYTKHSLIKISYTASPIKLF